MENLKLQLEVLISQGQSFDLYSQTINHNGYAREVELISYNKPQGRAGHMVSFCEDFEKIYNQAAIEAGKAEIEADIAAQEAAEAEAEAKRIEEKEAAEKAAIKAQEVLKAQYETQIEAERAKLAEYEQAKASKMTKATKRVVWFSLALLLGMSVVTFAMNIHNLGVLFGNIISIWYLGLFAFVLAFIPAIFAWLKDENKVEQSTYILPIDFAVAVILFVFCDTDSVLVQNWQWLGKNLHYVLMFFSIAGVGFYAYQVRLIYLKLLAIIADDKYKDFFGKIFE